MLGGLIVIGSIICIIEAVSLGKKKLRKELATVIVLMSIAIFLGLIKMLDLPNPINMLDNFLYPLGRKIFTH